MIPGLFGLFLLLFAGLFVGMLGGLMAVLPWRPRLGLTLSLSAAFLILGWRSPNPTLSMLIMTVCPALAVLAWMAGTWRAGQRGQERERGLGTKPNR